MTKVYGIGLLALVVGSISVSTNQPSALSWDTKEHAASALQASDADLYRMQSRMRKVSYNDLKAIPELSPLSKEKNVFLGSMFGLRIHPIFKIKRFHTGQDFPAPEGTPVIATADGIVHRAMADEDSSSYGRNIIIAHDGVYKTLYAHLSQVNVKRGMSVKKGDIIGYSGNTGYSTNPHLHYEVIRNGNHVDPRDYLPDPLDLPIAIYEYPTDEPVVDEAEIEEVLETSPTVEIDE